MARKGGSELIIVLDDSDTSKDEEGFDIDKFTRKQNMNIGKKMKRVGGLHLRIFSIQYE